MGVDGLDWGCDWEESFSEQRGGVETGISKFEFRNWKLPALVRHNPFLFPQRPSTPWQKYATVDVFVGLFLRLPSDLMM